MKRPGAKWIISYVNETGRRVTSVGYTDKAATEAMARHLEMEASQRGNGMIDPRQDAYRAHADRPLSDHFNEWQTDLLARGATAKHADMASDRARRLVAVARGARIADLDGKTMTRAQQVAARERIAVSVRAARLADLTAERVQAALSSLRSEGRSHQTCNHHRAAIRSFTRGPGRRAA